MSTRKLITDDGASDKLNPNVAHVDPVKYPSGPVDAQGRTDKAFDWGNGHRSDGSPDQTRPTEVRTYPSGEQNRQGRNDRSFADTVNNGRGVNDITAWTLSGVPGWQKPTAEPERQHQSDNSAYDATLAAKDKAGVNSSERLDKLKDAGSGNSYGDTSFDQKGNQRARNQGYERSGY